MARNCWLCCEADRIMLFVSVGRGVLSMGVCVGSLGCRGNRAWLEVVLSTLALFSNLQSTFVIAEEERKIFFFQ